jgi:hypothetical protein
MRGERVREPTYPTVSAFTADLAAGRPVPAGGSASALTGSVAAALMAMVCRVSLGRADDDALLSSLTQFDFLSCLVAVAPTDTQRSRSFYPNFARFYTERTEPIVERLIMDGQGPMRTMIFPADDTGLADALVLLNEVAYREAFAFAGWMGFHSPGILAFLEASASPKGDS